MEDMITEISFPVKKTNEPAEKFSTLEGLMDLAERGFRCKLRQSNPRLSAKQVEGLVRNWYHDRPGAPEGEFSGGRKLSLKEFRAHVKSFSEKP